MPPAVIGGAIAGVGAIGSAAVGSKAAKSAAKSAQASADQAAAVQREIYGENRDILTPYIQRGDVAGDYVNAFLGLPGAPAPAQPQSAQNAFSYVNIPGVGMVPVPGYQQPTVSAQPAQPSVTQGDAQNAFRNYITNSDYGFQFGEGSNAINSGYAGAGTLQSGAAMKDLERFRQDLQSGYRGEFLNAIGNQQGVGLSAGSALAGVGQNYANSLGTVYMNNGANQANAALLKGQNIGNAINSLATIGANIWGDQR